MESLVERVGEDDVVIDRMKYADLQQLAKRCGIKANVKADKLRTALLEFRNTQPEGNQRLHTMLLEYTNIQIQIEQSPTSKVESSNDASTNKLECCTDDQMEALEESCELTKCMNSSKHEDEIILPNGLCETSESFTDLVVDQAENHVVARRSTFDKSQNTASLACAQKRPASSLRKPKDWAAIHQRQFDKMDSLDVYVEKRQERHRRRFLQTPPKRAAALSASLNAPLHKATNEQITKPISSVKPKVFVPSVLSTTSMNVNFTAMYKTPSAGTASRPPNTGTGQKSVKYNRQQTPNEIAANKSISFSAVKSVFDLKASLARPLGYTPHHGKLKPFAAAHVDVKQATKTKSREHRREELNRFRQVQRQAGHMTRRQ